MAISDRRATKAMSAQDWCPMATTATIPAIIPTAAAIALSQVRFTQQRSPTVRIHPGL